MMQRISNAKRKNRDNNNSLLDSMSVHDSLDLADRIKVNEYKIKNQMDQINSLERVLEKN